MTTPRYIELIGLPGAGKTTAAKLLAGSLAESGIESTQRTPLNAGIFRKLSIVFGVCALLLRVPSLLGLWRYSVRAEYRGTPYARSVVQNVRARLLVEAVVVRQLCALHNKILVNDEGLIGKLVVFSILTGMREDRMIKLLHRVLPTNTCVVYVHTPTEVAVDRALERDIIIPFFHEMDAEERMRFYTLNAEWYSSVCERLQHTHGIQTIRIANTNTHDDLKKEIDQLVALQYRE
ncbi:MAG: hypothetical protein WDZ93_00790 [Candidatus Paceibacterota bacterium]